MIRLIRLSEQPVLRPRGTSAWEKGAVFNCAALFERGLIHLIYRATDRPSAGEPFISRLGYAISSDGITFNRLDQPLFEPRGAQEARGAEDPRIVKLGDTYYMLYTGYSGRDFKIYSATSKNLIYWHHHGILLDEQNKDASLFPEMIGERYLLIHRRAPAIWLAESVDLENWHEHTPILEPIAGSAWENEKIGLAGPPVRTARGWLMIYHGVSDDRVYSLGAALLDLEEPRKVLARQEEPILSPELEWEINGHVPRVVFSCGQADLGDRLLVYYGAADTVIGVAELYKRDIRFS
jgi:predicted GH43/DUF377 family glycosyl hydrolase